MAARRFFCLAVFLFPALFSLPAPEVWAAPQSVTDFSILPAPDASGKWGYVDASNGKTLIAPKYIEAGFFHDGVAIVTQAYPDEAYDAKTYDGGTMRVTPTRQGIINRDGQEIIEPRYTVERAYSSFGRAEERGFIPRLYRIRGGNGDIVFHADKGEIVPVGVHEKVSYTADGGVFCDGDYYSPDGKRHVPPSGCEIAWIERKTGMFRVRKKKEHGSLEGVMRQDGALIVPVKYHKVEVVNTSGGAVWLASRGDLSVKTKVAAAIFTGSAPKVSESEDILTVDVYDDDGKVLRSFRARYNPDVSGENYSYLSKGEKYTVNARTSQSAPEPKRPADVASGLQPFSKGGKWGLKKTDGTVAVEPQYEEISDLGGGLFAATKKFGYYKDNWGLIDGNGREIMPFIYGGISVCGYPSRATGPLMCKQWAHSAEPNTPHWLVSRNGSFITPKDKPYHIQFYFNEAGLAVVWRNRKYGVIDYTGKEVLPCIYQTVFDELRLNEGRERRSASQDKKAANSIPKPAPKEVLYRVELDNLWGLYDGTGRELIPVRYGFISVDIGERAEAGRA